MNMTTIFTSILNMSLTAGYCIVAVILLRFLLKRQPKILSYLLWSVVLFRLLCPVSLSSEFSLLRMDLPRMDMNVAAGADLTGQHTVGNAFTTDMHNDLEQNMDDRDKEALPAAEGERGIESRTQTLLTVGAWVWFAGVLLMAAYGIASAYRLKHFLQKAVCVEDNVYEVEGISSPFVFGIIHSRIYLPTGLPETERGYVLEHERVHVARKDYLVKILAWFARCIHWFNPLVWIFFVLMESDMEMSCDEAVLRRLGMETKQDYSRALLALSCEKKEIRNCPPAFGEGKVKERVRNVLNYRKRTFVTMAVIAVVLLAIVIGLALNPAGRKLGDKEAEELLRLGAKDQFVTDYADAWCNREGDALVRLYIDENTAFEHIPMLEKTERGYTFGLSSPWPDEFWRTIPTGEGTDEGKSEIRYYAWTSDPHVSVWKEEITFTMTDEGYRVTDSSLTYFDSIASEDEYMDAYWGDGGYHFTDYEERGFVEAINYQTEYDLENGESDRNAVYRSPETAAEYIMNLAGGAGTAQRTSNGTATVEYIFADGSSVVIPMKDANFNGQTGNSSDDSSESDSQTAVNSEVWILDLPVWNAGAP
ncbi:MAG: M56 family metallopeptidase [Lachnospiraceae bacterium]|nr:M56 family metallopeptidase [Lachnospiraceae bacterium]